MHALILKYYNFKQVNDINNDKCNECVRKKDIALLDCNINNHKTYEVRSILSIFHFCHTKTEDKFYVYPMYNPWALLHPRQQTIKNRYRILRNFC